MHKVRLASMRPAAKGWSAHSFLDGSVYTSQAELYGTFGNTARRAAPAMAAKAAALPQRLIVTGLDPPCLSIHPAGLSFNFEAAFAAYGGTLSDIYSFKGAEGDPHAAVAMMMKAKSEGSKRLDGVFITANNHTFVADFLRAAHKAKLDVPILSGDAVASTEVPTLLKDDLGALQRVTLTAFAQGPKELRSKLKEATPKGLDPDLGTSAQAYDAVTAVLKAYTAAAEPKSGADVAKQIPKQKFQGEGGVPAGPPAGAV